MYNCPHTGVALAVLTKLRRRGDIAGSDRVVVISTANGLKFTDFKLDYHRASVAELQPRLANAGRAAERLRRRAPGRRTGDGALTILDTVIGRHRQ